MLDMVNEPKSFSWSFSRLKAFEDCPRRYHETMVIKAWPEEASAMLEFGDDVHKTMAAALKNNVPLPTKYRIFQPWLDKVDRTEGELLIEDDCRWAVTRQMTPTAWFAKNVWLRCIADAVKLDMSFPPAALVVDWKTGKSLNGDPVQLLLTSLMMFLQFPDLKSVRSDFIWLQEDSQTTQVVYRNECAMHWENIMPRVARLEAAHKANNFPPIPGRFCARWCSVKSCEYNGKHTG